MTGGRRIWDGGVLGAVVCKGGKGRRGGGKVWEIREMMASVHVCPSSDQSRSPRWLDPTISAPLIALVPTTIAPCSPSRPAVLPAQPRPPGHLKHQPLTAATCHSTIIGLHPPPPTIPSAQQHLPPSTTQPSVYT
ncbi:hypothetical protein FRC12_020537, partial [Ceratobasidium sp. 428]